MRLNKFILKGIMKHSFLFTPSISHYLNLTCHIVEYHSAAHQHVINLYSLTYKFIYLPES